MPPASSSQANFAQVFWSAEKMQLDRPNFEALAISMASSAVLKVMMGTTRAEDLHVDGHVSRLRHVHDDRRLDKGAVTAAAETDALTLLKEHRPELVPELTIGLVCAGQNSGRMIDDICQQANTDRPDAFRFRDKSPGGWPGEITLRKHGQTSTLPNAYRHSIKPVYECHRCLACFDQMNVNADLVCGDPWGLEEHLGPEGCTAVLARTEQGLRLLVQAQIAGLVHLDQLTPQEIFRGQTVDTRHSDKVYTAKTVFQSEGWLYPYDPEVIGDRPYTSKVMEKNRKTLLYTRKYAQASTAQAAAEIAQRKKDKKLPLTARLKKLFK